jgi:hypothetical protein
MTHSGRCSALAYGPQPFIADMGGVNDDDVDLGLRMAKYLNNTFQVIDVAVNDSIPQSGLDGKEEVFNMFNELEPNETLAGHHLEDAAMPKFGINNLHFLKLDVKSSEGSHFSMLTCTLMLLNACASHRCTNGFVDELLSLL